MTTTEHPVAALHDLLLPNLAGGACIVHADLAGLGSPTADAPSVAQVVDTLADAIFAHVSWGDSPVVVVPFGTIPPAEELGRLCGYLSDELDVPVVTCVGDVTLTEGRLHGSETFLQWSPAESDEPRAAGLDLGHYYPPMPYQPEPVDPEPVDEEAVEAPRVDVRPVELELGRLPVPTGAVLSSRPAPVAEPAEVEPDELEPDEVEPDEVEPDEVEPDEVEPPSPAGSAAPVLLAPIHSPPTEPSSEPASADTSAVARPTPQPVPLTTPWMDLPSVDPARLPPERPPTYTHDRPVAPAEADLAHANQATQTNDSLQPRQPDRALTPRTESALWTPLRSGIQPAGRDELKELLGWRYEACLRSVTSALALHPTLRSAASAEHDLPTLIALNAYLTGSTEAVDAALRGELAGDDSRHDLLRALAAGAVAGLTRFPISRSPIFVAGTTTSEVLSGLVPGEVLVEPAFVLASSRPNADESGEEAGKRIQYALWPQTARRIAQLMPTADGSAPLVVAAGSSWRVLGFADDEDGTAGWDPVAPVSPHLPTVFLAQAGGRAAASDETLLERLGRALEEAPGTYPGPPRGALGHDRNGNRFRLEPLDETEIRSAQ